MRLYESCTLVEPCARAWCRKFAILRCCSRVVPCVARCRRMQGMVRCVSSCRMHRCVPHVRARHARRVATIGDGSSGDRPGPARHVVERDADCRATRPATSRCRQPLFRVDNLARDRRCRSRRRPHDRRLVPAPVGRNGMTPATDRRSRTRRPACTRRSCSSIDGNLVDYSYEIDGHREGRRQRRRRSRSTIAIAAAGQPRHQRDARRRARRRRLAIVVLDFDHALDVGRLQQAATTTTARSTLDTIDCGMHDFRGKMVNRCSRPITPTAASTALGERDEIFERGVVAAAERGERRAPALARCVTRLRTAASVWRRCASAIVRSLRLRRRA